MQHEPRPEQQSLYDEYLVGRLVPEDHPLLKIDRVVDFDFVRELVKDLYSGRTGRPAVDPALLLRLCFLQSYYGLSDREVVSRAQTDLALRRFLHLGLEEELPHPSLLSVFRRRLGVRRFREIFNASVRQAMARRLVTGRLLMLDSYGVVGDIAIPRLRRLLMRLVRRGLRALEGAGEETAELREERAALEADNSFQQGRELRSLDLAQWFMLARRVRDGLEQVRTCGEAGEKARRLAEVMAKALQREAGGKPRGRRDTLVSDVDPEARWSMRERGKRAYVGYKEQVAADGEHEIITAVEVTPANVDDKGMLEPLVEASSQATGMTPEAVVADSGYSSGENRRRLKEEGVEDFIAPPAPKGHAAGKLSTQDFQIEWSDDGRPVLVKCPAGETAAGGKYRKAKGGWVFHFRRRQCERCPLRETCGGGRRGRAVFVGEYHRELRQARARSETAEFQAAQLKRLSIERTFAFQKRRSGMHRARYRGLAGVTIQAYLSCFMTNLVRIARAATAGESGPPARHAWTASG